MPDFIVDAFKKLGCASIVVRLCNCSRSILIEFIEECDFNTEVLSSNEEWHEEQMFINGILDNLESAKNRELAYLVISAMAQAKYPKENMQRLFHRIYENDGDI
jgi:hypothetical protein